MSGGNDKSESISEKMINHSAASLRNELANTMIMQDQTSPTALTLTEGT